MTDLLQNSVSIQAQRRPDAVALVMEGRALTYGQLEKVTNQLARLLQAAGCKKGDRVCFAIPKSPEAIVAILGILKADCIHVPLDTASPAPRIAKLLRSSEPRYVLGVGASANLLEQLFSSDEFRNSIRVGWMEPAAEGKNFTPTFTSKDIATYSSEPLQYGNTAEDPAHLLYTSGSTGEPKGVAITHANVTHFVNWATRYFGMADSDRVSCHPPLHFDLATFDIFGAFAVGAQLHLVPAELNLLPNNLADFIRDSELTQWFSVPSVLNYMAKFDVVKGRDFPTLKRILWCGEVFPTSALIYWMKRLPEVSFTNLYGPTETTIASSYYTVPLCPAEGSQPVPIGTACDGEELLVLDKELRAVAAGEVGDLYIQGVGLSPGYWRDPEKTRLAFLPYGDGGRIYRTGDLAKIGDDGLVYFVGRADTQIKSRGYRIELGEIEVVLNTFDELKECAVVAVPTDGFENNLICCAYVVRDPIQLTASEIRYKLSKVLPPYMLPSRFRSFKQLPKNANGKIDRRKIEETFTLENAAQPEPQSEADLRCSGSEADVPQVATSAPRTAWNTRAQE
jgi:amino acid adenylation domain-containing protein